MDPLTALLAAAAAATGPNTLQSQALAALRSAGPQESFFTRMGNPHPLQVQQLAQPAPPQLTPTITQPTMAPMAPTAFTQPLSVPTMPMASPMADPTTGALHLPTLQAIHRMQQAPVLVPTMPPSGCTASRDGAKRPDRVYPDQLSCTHPTGQAQPASTTTRLSEAGQDTQLRPSSEPHAAPRRERQTEPQQEPHQATASTPPPIQKPPS